MVFIRYGRLSIDQHDVQSIQEIKSRIHQLINLHEGDYYFVSNGKRIDEREVLGSFDVTLVPRLVGGKGGFGSMLRAIGAQIEKTTNREACRDLSGRRLRDVNEEKRQKELLKTKREQEQRAVENRRRKLEKCLEGPQLELIDDKKFNEMRSSLPESLQEAINEGLKVEEKVTKSAEAGVGKKRPRNETDTVEKKTAVVKKKRKLWIDDGIDSSSCDSELSENEK